MYSGPIRENERELKNRERKREKRETDRPSQREINDHFPYLS